MRKGTLEALVSDLSYCPIIDNSSHHTYAHVCSIVSDFKFYTDSPFISLSIAAGAASSV